MNLATNEKLRSVGWRYRKGTVGGEKLTSLGQSSEVRSGSKFLGNTVRRRTGWSKAHAHRNQGGSHDADHSSFLKLPQLPQQGEKVRVQQSETGRQAGLPTHSSSGKIQCQLVD